MLSFILKRLFYGVLVLCGVVVIVFFLFNVLPGDPARMMLGQRADISSIEAINKDLGLDQPTHMRFLNYANDLSPVSIHNRTNTESYWYLDDAKYAPYFVLAKPGRTKQVICKKPYMRRSYLSKRKVSDILKEAFPLTALLAISAISFALLTGVFIGVICALVRDSIFDRLSLAMSVFGMSLPSFFMAILMAWLFAFVLGEYTGLNMIGSLYRIDDFGSGEYLQLKNLLLPALTLGIRPLAIVIELTRSSLLDVLGQDYIRTARAKGLAERHVIWRHGLRNALNPVITAITGWFASLMAGAVFVEYVFDWKGIGVVIVQALDNYDFPVVMGAVLFISVILVFINIFVDILYGALDPRIRLT